LKTTTPQTLVKLDEVKEYLKNNLTIDIKMNFHPDYYGGGSTSVEVSLLLEGEKISTSYSSI